MAKLDAEVIPGEAVRIVALLASVISMIGRPSGYPNEPKEPNAPVKLALHRANKFEAYIKGNL